MSDLLSFLDSSACERLIKVVTDNFNLDTNKIDKFIEELLRQYIEKEDVNNEDFIKIVNNALSKIRIIDKISENYIILKNDKAYENILNEIKQIEKDKLKSAFVYCYIKNSQKKSEKKYDKGRGRDYDKRRYNRRTPR